jgi:hypothetical protein
MSRKKNPIQVLKIVDWRGFQIKLLFCGSVSVLGKIAKICVVSSGSLEDRFIE